MSENAITKLILISNIFESVSERLIGCGLALPTGLLMIGKKMPISGKCFYQESKAINYYMTPWLNG